MPSNPSKSGENDEGYKTLEKSDPGGAQRG
jgi:hypothetical protein